LNRVGYVYDPIYLEHITGNHPENPRRLEAIMDHLAKSGLLQQLVPITAVAATEQDLRRVHTERMILLAANLAGRGGGRIDMDTLVSSRSYEAALYAAGGTMAAVQATADGQVDAAFALVRPPGHHATPRQSMGFCIFNNVAVTARWAQERLGMQRIAILDFDVHHGNGTDDVFDADPDVLYISTHEYPLYPGTGDWRRPTHVRGPHNNLNIPLPAETDDVGYMQVFHALVEPALRRFRPDLLLVSAGYDGHWADPLAWQMLSLHCYYEIAASLYAISQNVCPGRLVFTLEGGYDVNVLSAGVEATFAALLGLPFQDPLGPARAQGVAVDQLIRRLAEWHMIELAETEHPPLDT
jgi:acetoin utilization deacetylase AcuC-like enzyme